MSRVPPQSRGGTCLDGRPELMPCNLLRVQVSDLGTGARGGGRLSATWQGHATATPNRRPPPPIHPLHLPLLLLLPPHYALHLPAFRPHATRTTTLQSEDALATCSPSLSKEMSLTRVLCTFSWRTCACALDSALALS